MRHALYSARWPQFGLFTCLTLASALAWPLVADEPAKSSRKVSAAVKDAAAKPESEAKPASETKADADKQPVPPADESAKPAGEKYTLRYRFKPSETLRWDIEHRSQIRSTVSGTTQTAETTSQSVKVWRVKEVAPSGNAVFVHSVESIDMRQKLSGRQEVHYNSRTDKEVPQGFQDAAKSVGVPLTTFTIDTTGKVVDRVDHLQRSAGQSSYPTIPLPTEPVAIDGTWEHTYEVTATTKDQALKKVQMRQRMRLESVTNGVATISIDTHILSPVRQDPTIEAQLVQSESVGKVRFDIEAGRLLSQQCDLDKHVVGFQGPTSSLHCVTRFTERLNTDSAASTAARPAGPAAPKKKASR